MWDCRRNEGRINKEKGKHFPSLRVLGWGAWGGSWAYDAFGWGHGQGGESCLESRRHREGLGGSKGRNKKPQRPRRAGQARRGLRPEGGSRDRATGRLPALTVSSHCGRHRNTQWHQTQACVRATPQGVGITWPPSPPAAASAPCFLMPPKFQIHMACLLGFKAFCLAFPLACHC